MPGDAQDGDEPLWRGHRGDDQGDRQRLWEGHQGPVSQDDFFGMTLFLATLYRIVLPLPVSLVFQDSPQSSSYKFNPLIKYSETSITVVIIIRIVVEENVEGEQFRRLRLGSSQSRSGLLWLVTMISQRAERKNSNYCMRHR